MQTIQLLDKKTINKIAAGEVVESPKSVVKELVENSIDAGSTSIIVEIADGGTTLIRISDNGKGINKEDLEVAFAPHATSKLVAVEDLESIFTLGFRGEALASIASVAQVELITKTNNDDVGNTIEIHGGEVQSIGEVASGNGTTIIVKNLFYNVIARRKFLKKPATESSYISDLMNKFALGYPKIAFKYINNGTTVLYTNGNGDLKSSIFQVYGKEITANMLPISYKNDDFEVFGMIGKPELSRNNRNYENLFINGRFIKNAVVAKGVEEGYKTRLMTGKFPVFIVNLKVEPSFVDVNVHPAKLEVRFKDEDAIYEFFMDAILKTFENENLIPKISFEKPEKPKPEEKPEQQIIEYTTPKKEFEKIQVNKSLEKDLEKDFQKDFKKDLEKDFQKDVREKRNNNSYSESLNELLKMSNKAEKVVRQEATFFDDTKVEEVKKEVEKEVEKEEEKRTPFFTNYKIIGQLFDTYWLIEQNQSLFMIDQHAGHERVLFEKIMSDLKNNKVYSQKLLIPFMLELDPLESNAIEENLELLDDFGFQLEKYTSSNYSLKGVPYILGQPSEVSFFMEILSQLMDVKISSVYDMKLNAVATKACKAAIKGNSKIAKAELETLIEQLLELENPFSCPHGRPVIIEMTKYEVEKMFKRIQM